MYLRNFRLSDMTDLDATHLKKPRIAFLEAL